MADCTAVARIIVVGTSAALAACGNGSDGGPLPPTSCCTESGLNPVIGFGTLFPRAFWNDPSVRREDGQYRMWLTAGDPLSSPIRVAVYEATSPDGLAWTIDPVEQFSPTGKPGDFDELRTETPEVVLHAGTYHLYYSGCTQDDTNGCENGVYAIGHATSTDGEHWVRDPANPVVTAQTDPGKWGFFTAAEPGVIYHPGRGEFLLYHVGIRIDADGKPEAAILLARSPDGSSFTHVTDAAGDRRAVVRLGSGYPATFGGVTQPDPVLDGAGRVHLFYTVVSDFDSFSTHSLVHAVSDDGVDFTEVERDILPAGRGDWKEASGGRAASVLLENGRFLLWFQGNRALSTIGQPDFRAGIGFATSPVDCP
ncbi:hypothetical protein [Inmirania thermothiophila]|uniref:Glycosyl hydrolase family 32 n=1 Tax=Inmirania thermothiophila TaxID=1750597 RepID=A0A3N1Y470_9GAMM|nr:hypothetical protein [Inmirania thermothiophila]ROR32067.1 hypothetical protein EDC57_1255 [Inmirania thermothiophila]